MERRSKTNKTELKGLVSLGMVKNLPQKATHPVIITLNNEMICKVKLIDHRLIEYRFYSPVMQHSINWRKTILKSYIYNASCTIVK